MNTAHQNGHHSDADSGVAALGREVERLTRKLTDLDHRHAELDQHVLRLAEDVASLLPANDGEEPESLPSWLTVHDTQAAVEMLTDLADWLSRVYLRYSDAGLSWCWAWHPDVVEELWWLRQAHYAAFEGLRASWREIGDWHDRQRPGVVRRVHKTIGSCDLSLHAEGGRRAHRTPVAPLSTAINDLATHWATNKTMPHPTEQQRAEADNHDRQRIRTTR